MTIEVAVMEAYKPDLSAGELRELEQQLDRRSASERKKVIEECNALRKQIYYHCSDYKPQVAAVTTHNMEVMIREALASGELKPKSTVWLKMDGCAKQYKCGKAMYLLCELAFRLREHGITLDQMNEVTGHGKDEADGHGGVFKNWLINEMRRVDLLEDEGGGPAIEMADVTGETCESFATAMCKVAEAGLTAVKTEAMNRKRSAKRSTAQRNFRLYTAADIGQPPEINAMTDVLARDAPRDRKLAAQVEHDKMVKATLAHNNYRADPELQLHGKPRVVMVRRIACGCPGCKRHLAMPVAERYKPHDDCERAAMFSRMNDWKRVELKPASEAAAARMQDDDELQLQALQRQ